MKTAATSIENLFEKLEDYGKTTYQVSKLKVLEKVIIISISLIARISVIIIFSFFALILNIGVALLIGGLLGRYYYGFFIIAAFYLLVGVILKFHLHKWIKKPVSEYIIAQALQS